MEKKSELKNGTDVNGDDGLNYDKNTEKKERFVIPAALLLTGMAGIVLEIGLTRIFSISLWHHFAFLSIAVALFGLGASGVFLSVRPSFIGKNMYRNLYKFAWLFSLSIILSFFVFTRLNLDVRNLGNPVNLLKFAVFYLLQALPFFWSGCVMSTIISRKSEIVQKLYFFDLVGSGIGCLVVTFLISSITGQGVVVLAAFLAALAALFLSTLAPRGNMGDTKRFNAIALYAAALILSIPAAGFLFPAPLPHDKALAVFKSKGAKVIDSKWNSFSRVDTFAPIPKYAWALSPGFKGDMQEQIGITIDGDGFTSIVKLKDIADVEFPRWTLNSMVHELNTDGSALIIGAGGGIDVLSALRLGAKEIDAVEINPSITDLVTNKYREYSGELFFRPGINIHTAEGRNFIKRSDRKYGLVYLPLVDSWAATYSGAYSLSENFLYTTEAFRDYYKHVKEGGFISISRWEAPPPRQPYQTLRLCSLAMSSTDRDLRNSVIITSSGQLANFIWKKGDFTQEEIEKIRNFCNRCGFTVQYVPGMENDFTKILDPESSKKFIEEYPLDITAVSDDRPFFYLTDRWKYLMIYVNNTLKKGSPLPVVFTIVLTILFLSILFSAIFIFVPLGVKSFKDVSRKQAFGFLLYFALLGLAFMFVEVTLMTKFTLYLGHPVYALSVILFSLLLFTGIGSLVSGGIKAEPRKLLGYAVGLLSIVGVVYYLFLDGLLLSTLPLSIVKRVMITILLMAPAGFFMGIPFPLGLKTLGADYPSLIPWAWGVNGTASVLGTAGALVGAQAVGFWKTLLIALTFYVCCFFTFLFLDSEKAGRAAVKKGKK